MKKSQLEALISDLEEDDEIDLNELVREEHEARQAFVEELEERQHASGFYAFQDRMALMRYER